MKDKIDTSTLGPVRIDHDAVARRAKLVREALLAIAHDPASPPRSVADRNAAEDMARASDATLAKLGRLLR